MHVKRENIYGDEETILGNVTFFSKKKKYYFFLFSRKTEVEVFYILNTDSFE